MEMDDTGGWGEGGGVEGQPGASVCHRERGELRARVEDSEEYFHCRVEIRTRLFV